MPKHIPEHRAGFKNEVMFIKHKTINETIEDIVKTKNEMLQVKDYQSQVLMVEILRIIDSFELMEKTTENLMFACAQLLNYRKQLVKYQIDVAVISKKESNAIKTKRRLQCQV